MKKLLLLVAGAFCAAALLPAPAMSGVQNSRHDMANSTASTTYAALGGLAKYGTCSACHIPHGAGADRLFPSTSGSVGGFFGGLCGSCHDQAVVAGTNANLDFNANVLNTTAHGLTIADITVLGSDYAATGSGLKYTSLAESPRATKVAEIECLTCHDVHNASLNRPFMAVPMDELCQKCHTNREIATTAATGYSNVDGNHPSGDAFTGDMGTASGFAVAAANSPITLATMIAWTDTNSDGSTWDDAAWNSGPHLQLAGAASKASGSSVGCVSCHNVHWDEAGPPSGTPFYLGFSNELDATSSANIFCETCHRGGPLGVGTPGTGGFYWNPGATAFSHPNDANGSVNLQSTAVAGYPITAAGQTSARSGSGASGLICTSCHGVHRADATAPETKPGTPNLLYAAGTVTNTWICAVCHTSASTTTFNHHPTGGSYATAGNGAGNVTCFGGDVGAGVGTCHGYRAGGAANGIAHNRDSGLDQVNTNYSAMCVACHTVNPSTYTTTTTYTASGLASHWVGTNADVFTTSRTTWTTGAAGDPIRYAGTGVSLAGGAIATVNWAGSGLPSKFGAAADDLICESCHRLKAGNIISGDGATRMLVEVSGSAAATITVHTPPVATTDYSTTPYLCTGCHLVPTGTHPLNGANTAKFALPASPAGLSYVAATGLNCESCHSPHDADTITGSYILDGGSDTGTGTATTTAAEMSTLTTFVEPTVDYTGFCARCHGGYR
jgi:predicted CXXCH cytochrome family protein